MNINEGDMVDFKEKFIVASIVREYAVLQQKLYDGSELSILVPCKFLEASNGAWR